MTDYLHHVFVKPKSTGDFRALGLDLSSDDLKNKILKPYKAGKDIYIFSTVTSVSDIQKIVIVRSSLTAKEVLKRRSDEHAAYIKRQNEESGLVILGSFRGNSPLELMECCDNVTDAFIADAPGSGTFATKAYAFFHNQWVTGIGLLVIGILIGKLLGGGA